MQCGEENLLDDGGGNRLESVILEKMSFKERGLG